MSLLQRAVDCLEASGCRFALIGAAAMAYHGASRSTQDIDLLTLDPKALLPDTWRSLEDDGVEVEVRRGSFDDPLAGVVRCGTGDHRVDIVVGKGAWVRKVARRARSGSFAGVTLPVVTSADLILMKLYAGGPKDSWDIEQLLDALGREQLSKQVEEHLAELPTDARRLWERIRSP